LDNDEDLISQFTKVFPSNSFFNQKKASAKSWHAR
jgi:hypothetical protein